MLPPLQKILQKKYPEVLDTVVKVQRELLDWIKKNPEEAIGLGAKEHGIDMDDARKLASWSNYYNTLSEKDIEGPSKRPRFLIRQQNDGKES